MKRNCQVFVLFLLLGLLIGCQYWVDQIKNRQPKIEPVVLPAPIIQVANLGLDNASADLLWIASIQYFGNPNFGKYGQLNNFLDTITNLDPTFAYPYAFGTLILPGLDRTDNAITLAKRGLERNPENWEIPYYLGTLFHIYKEDQTSAMKYFDMAANAKTAPDNIRIIAANYGSREDKRDKTIAIWQGILDNSKDAVVQQRAHDYIDHLEILSILENAGQIYAQKFGTYPDSLESLVEKNILPEIPKDPFGFNYQYESDGSLAIL